MILYVTVFSTAIRGAPRLVAGASRCSQVCCWRSQACCWRSQACCWHSQACCQCSQVLPGAPRVLSGALRCTQTNHNNSHGTPRAVIRDPNHSKGQPECPPSVWYSPDIYPSWFTLHILSDTPGGFQWLKYILLMLCTALRKIWYHILTAVVLTVP